MISDSADHYAGPIKNNVSRAFSCARLDLQCFDMSEPSNWPDLNDFSALVFCTEALQKLDQRQIDSIRRFVSLGGGLAIVYRGWNVALADLFGVTSDTTWPDLVVGETEGLCFQSDIFPGFDGLQLTHNEISGHTAYDLAPNPDATILANSFCGRPLAWLTRFGEGRVIYWNSVVLSEKNARGLIVQTVAAVQAVSVIPIANIAALQIDDFPPEMFEQTLDPIASEYEGMNNLAFYDQIWFADMVSLARKHDLRYTWLAVFDYDDSVPPNELEFDSNGKRQSAINKIPINAAAAQSAANEGELGLHGYNHFPLLLDSWETSDQMVIALKASATEWQANGLGALPTTYVPPNNEYDKSGALALSRVYPKMEAICGLFGGGDFERGGNREFGPEPWNPNLFCFPRATSGYELIGLTRFALASQIGTMGVWTHFLHTDDVYETPENFPDGVNLRNELSHPWRVDKDGQKSGLFHRFEEGIEFVRATYPWLNFVETREALPILKSHLKNEIRVLFGSNAVSLTSTQPSYFQIRINDGRHLNPVGLSNAEIVDVQHGTDSTLYTLRSTKSEVHVEII